MNPSTLIFLGLAVVWVIVLLPEAMRKLSATRSSDSIRTFNHQLSALRRQGEQGMAGGNARSNVISMNGARGNRASSASSAPQSAAVQVPASVRKRRQEVMTTLASAAVLTLLCTIAFGSVFLVLHVIADVLLVAYIALVVQANKAPAPSFTNSLSSGYSPANDYGLRTATVRQVNPAPRRVAN
ncbi:MAG: hypothetical protein WBA45_16150 [Microthrixaceae bacterium]